MKKMLFLLCLLPLLAMQCNEWGFDTSRGMKPIYAPQEDMSLIKVEAPRPLKESSKIYYKDKFIFVIEQGVGVHILDNRDSTKPQNIRFIRIFGCSDIAIKGTTLFADNFTDLVAIDLSKVDTPTVINRIPNLYPNQFGTGKFPENYNGYFECVDSSKGRVIGWKETLLDNPQCRR
jgi:hypothetical protein